MASNEALFGVREPSCEIAARYYDRPSKTTFWFTLHFHSYEIPASANFLSSPAGFVTVAFDRICGRVFGGLCPFGSPCPAKVATIPHSAPERMQDRPFIPLAPVLPLLSALICDDGVWCQHTALSLSTRCTPPPSQEPSPIPSGKAELLIVSINLHPPRVRLSCAL